MKLRPIPDPVLTPYRRKRPEPKPLVQVAIPRPPASPQPEAPKKPAGNKSGNEPEIKPAQNPSNPPKQRENLEKSGNETTPEVAPKIKKQELPLPPVSKTDDGTILPQPFKPVDPITALASPNPAVAFVMLRQLRDMQGEMPDTSNGALAVLDKLEKGLKSGQDISALTDEISTYILGDEEHNELFIRLHDAHDRERSTEIDKSRSKWEDFCHACMRRGDLTIIEGMALMSYFNSQQQTIFSRIERKRAKGDAAISRESHDLVERVNRPTLLQNKQLQRKFDDASPQEREILRKLGFKLEQALAARITTTTETQTVEIVQANGPQPTA